MAKKVFVDQFSEPLNGAKTARIDIHAGDGNLTVDRLATTEPTLANGSLQYLENQGKPVKTLVANNGQATLTLKGNRARQPWFHLPWQACNGATDWQIHLNPTVTSDITVHSDGGNVRLDLAGMVITRVIANTGAGTFDTAAGGWVACCYITSKSSTFVPEAMLRQDTPQVIYARQRAIDFLNGVHI